MNTNLNFYALKLKLQQYGALRPEAWEAILGSLKKAELKTGESFIRKAGTLAYVAEGLLKEYDAHKRKSPSIINFIFHNQCLITRKYNQSHYLKACLPSILFYWDFEDLQILYQAYKELKPVYDVFCAEYDEGIALDYCCSKCRAARFGLSFL